MKASLLLLCFFIGVSVSTLAPLLQGGDELIPGSYLVVFKTGIADDRISAHISDLKLSILGAQDNTTNQLVHEYNINNEFKGYAALLSKQLLEKTRNSEDVEYVEVDQKMKINSPDACSTQQTTEWGLDRISERALNLDGKYIYPSTAGAGVDSYIIDTGIRITHNEFATGRAIWGGNYVGDNINTDCHGHGTHVAGTVAGEKYGVAKLATVLAVKVLGCSGSGSTAGVAAGVNFVATSAANRKKPSNANMSLGGGKSTALDAAVRAAVSSGVTFILAAGNSNNDACTMSPGGTGGKAGTSITVGSTTVAQRGSDEEDARSSFSSFGTCVDVFAPGELITSAWSTSDTATRTISGTSMASPHVAGVVTLKQGDGPKTPATMKSTIATEATKDLIDLGCRAGTTCAQSPNALLFSPCE